MLNLTELTGFGSNEETGIRLIGYQVFITNTGAGDTDTFGTWLGGIGGSLQQNDLLVMAVSCGASGNQVAGTDYGPTGSHGLTQVCDLFSDDSYDTNLYVGYQVCGVSPPTSKDVATNSEENHLRIYLAFRGVNTSTPMDATATTATGTNENQANGPAITPVTTGAKVVSISAFASRSQSGDTDIDTLKTAPANMTLIVKDSANTEFAGPPDGQGAACISWADWTSGAFNPDALTGTGSTTSDSWSSCTLALRPA